MLVGAVFEQLELFDRIADIVMENLVTGQDMHPRKGIRGQKIIDRGPRAAHAKIPVAGVTGFKRAKCFRVIAPLRMWLQVKLGDQIVDGDVVRVFNERGACLAGAVLDDALMPEVVQLSTGAWYDPDSQGMCRAGNPNVLTRDKGTSKLAQGPSAHTCLVDIERFNEPAPRVEAYDPPELIQRPQSRDDV